MVAGPALGARTGSGVTGRTGPGSTGTPPSRTTWEVVRTVLTWVTTELGTPGTTGAVTTTYHSSVRNINSSKSFLTIIRVKTTSGVVAEKQTGVALRRSKKVNG